MRVSLGLLGTSLSREGRLHIARSGTRRGHVLLKPTMSSHVAQLRFMFSTMSFRAEAYLRDQK